MKREVIWLGIALILLAVLLFQSKEASASCERDGSLVVIEGTLKPCYMFGSWYQCCKDEKKDCQVTSHVRLVPPNTWVKLSGKMTIEQGLFCDFDAREPGPDTIVTYCCSNRA